MNRSASSLLPSNPGVALRQPHIMVESQQLAWRQRPYRTEQFARLGDIREPLGDGIAMRALAQPLLDLVERFGNRRDTGVVPLVILASHRQSLLACHPTMPCIHRRRAEGRRPAFMPNIDPLFLLRLRAAASCRHRPSADSPSDGSDSVGESDGALDASPLCSTSLSRSSNGLSLIGLPFLSNVIWLSGCVSSYPCA